MMEVGVAGRPGGQTVGTGAVGAKRRVSSICSNTLLLLDTTTSLLRERLALSFSLLLLCCPFIAGSVFPWVCSLCATFIHNVCVSMCVTF